MPRRAYQQLTHLVRRSAVASTVLAALLLAGCGRPGTGLTLSTPAPEAPGPVSAAPVATNPPTTGTHSASPSAAPSPAAPRTSAAPQAVEQQVITAYTAYDNLLKPLSSSPASSRPAALSKVAVDPLYSAVLEELARRDQAGTVLYGRVILHPKVVGLQPTVAGIEDCQDTSQAGLMRKSTGEKLTVGVSRFKEIATLTRGADGVWRVATISRTPQGTC